MLFLPRQVALSAAAAAAMAKEESRKEKRSKTKAASSSSKDPSADARRAAVVAAVAAFLESSGFPRALAALQSEANLEAGSWRASPVSLEELVSKFLEDSSNSAPGASINGSIEHEKTAAGVAEDAGKKKKKKGGDTEVSEAENKAAEPSAVEKPSENADVETKEKKQKKKKSKKQENDEDVEARLEKAESAIINKFETVDTLKEDSKNGLVDVAPVEKGKKKKKGKSTPETSDKVDTGSTDAGADCAKGKGDAAEMEKDNNEKKSKKKLKKSKENVEVVENKEVAGNGSAPKSNDENNSGMETDKGENGMPPSDNAVVGKKRKLEEVKGSNLPAKEDDTASQKLSNGSSEDDAKPNKRQKKSSEPKTVNAFQRVKLEDVKFADERLQDNSYWAKGGADSGYGAKAQEVLGQVRGRGFRHEKTKKKRGSYRGGQIDLQTHSIKFNDSDDE
uniref:Srp40 C-terminal domain-containing protein n=1 Tax=Oryza meridionalis TaxID=40149 RepID=A0A0E0FEE8_9ORYZ